MLGLISRAQDMLRADVGGFMSSTLRIAEAMSGLS